ncbi:MAG: hypothetical protein U9Q33_02250 [Campylobacterota bacterium]|nr:hypothetical protein [Campylobacterota bacterium]
MKDKYVLLIEDDIDLQNLISSYLQDYNYKCDSFCYPMEALERFKKDSSRY